ncbi:hypothetical protein BH20ACT2_BH20ACT2_03710 [soil metagenome]
MRYNRSVTTWETFADALLQREAVRFHAARGLPPDPMGGLVIRNEEVGPLLAELPGLASSTSGDEPRLERSVAAAREALHASLGEWSSFAALVHRAGLGPVEIEVLAFAAAVELDGRRQRLLAYVQDDPSRTQPTLFTLGRMLGPDRVGALAVSESSRLRRAALVELDEGASWAGTSLRVAPVVLWGLLGDQSPDLALPVDAGPVGDADVPADGADLVVVTGEDKVRRLQVALVATRGQAFLITPPPGSDDAWAAVVRSATRGGMGVVVEVDGDLDDDGRRWIARADHLAWALSSRSEIPIERLPLREWVEYRAEDAAPSDQEWRDALGAGVPRSHALSADQLRRAARAQRALGGDLDAAVRRLAGGSLERLAVRISPQRGWDALVLAPDRLAQLHELVARYRHRRTVYEAWGYDPLPSTGLVTLFAGPSGTGKTLAAEIIAADLGVDLYKLELSSVVSKYIGETEKHLEKIFEAASAANVVLFFDEADALLGKRSEVSDAHDRYANIETAYLLQRLERHDGVVVLATNFAQNIDQAFLRRIHQAVEFPMPEAPERRAIWERSFGPAAPLDGVDLDAVASRFVLSGGAIRNIGLAAGFLAADAGTSITTATVLHAVKREYQKLGKLVTKDEFGDWWELVSAR